MKLVSALHVSNNCVSVSIGNVGILFSYETAIAFRSPTGNGRLANSWGPTTGKHFREGGAKEWPILGDDEFEAKLKEALKKGLD